MDVHRHGTAESDYAAAHTSPLLPSSSPANGLLSPTRTTRRKERRDPSVTPRRFGRFFTPRPSQPIAGRRILVNIAAEELNRQPISPQSLASDALSSDPIIPSPSQLPSSPSRTRKRSSPRHHAEPNIRRRGLVLDDMHPPLLNLPERGDVFQHPPNSQGQDVLGDWRKNNLVCLESQNQDVYTKTRQNRFFRTSRGQDQSMKDRLIRDALRGPPPKRQRAEVRHQWHDPLLI